MRGWGARWGVTLGPRSRVQLSIKRLLLLGLVVLMRLVVLLVVVLVVLVG